MNLGDIVTLQKKIDALPIREGPFHFIYNTDVLLHQPPTEHPESFHRARVILEACVERAQTEPWVMEQASPAGWTALRAIHDSDYLLALESTGHANKPFFKTEDCALGFDSLDGILAAGGCAMTLGKHMASGGCGFALTRPPGHHAGQAEAEGFCFLNHSAIAVNQIRQSHPQAKILVVDFDVHHGNGIEEFFLESDETYYFSIHGTPKHLYPWTGEERVTGKGMGEGFTNNVTLPIGTSGPDWIQAFEENLIEVEKQFKPDFILVSAGFDAHLEDPFALMKVEDKEFHHAVQLLITYANRCSEDRVGFMLEGGYSLEVLGRLVPDIISNLNQKFNG